MDTKKREMVRQFKNGGREWAPKYEPAEVNTHDLPSQARGKATRYGVYGVSSAAELGMLPLRWVVIEG